jgi:hypothetical protein
MVGRLHAIRILSDTRSWCGLGRIGTIAREVALSERLIVRYAVGELQAMGLERRAEAHEVHGWQLVHNRVGQVPRRQHFLMEGSRRMLPGASPVFEMDAPATGLVEFQIKLPRVSHYLDFIVWLANPENYRRWPRIGWLETRAVSKDGDVYELPHDGLT